MKLRNYCHDNILLCGVCLCTCVLMCMCVCVWVFTLGSLSVINFFYNLSIKLPLRIGDIYSLRETNVN